MKYFGILINPGSSASPLTPAFVCLNSSISLGHAASLFPKFNIASGADDQAEKLSQWGVFRS